MKIVSYLFLRQQDTQSKRPLLQELILKDEAVFR